MRSSKSNKRLKSFTELKTVIGNHCPPLPEAVERKTGISPPILPALQNEHQLFRLAMADVTPLANRMDRISKPLNRPPFRSRPLNPDREVLAQLKNLVHCGEGFVISDTPEYMQGTGCRVPDSIARRLHQGNFSIQSFIDLHGLSAAEAEETFESFMSMAVKNGKRGVLIVHGRGLSSPDQPVLKSRVYDWLTRGRWRNWVIAFASARSCDGGTGATYVLLRRQPLPKRLHKKR